MTKKNTSATFKTFEAARLTAGKYAGIPKGKTVKFLPDESQEYEKFVTAKHFGSNSRTLAALTVSQVAKSGLEYMGLFAVPAGLKAAAKMARKVSGEYSGSRFCFGFDAAGRWSYEFDDPEGMASTDASAEDLGADGVTSFASSMREMPAVVWALASFDVVQLWKNEKGFFFFAIGNVDDGRILLLNNGIDGDFRDPSEAVEESAGAVEETDQEVESSRGGVEVHQEAKTAMEAKETAKRDLSKDFRPGDVVKITGTTNGRNGYFYVVDLHDDGTPYKLQGLKKCRNYDTFKDEATKKVEYWPLCTYASSPNVCAEFREAVKNAKITNFGPISVVAYQAMKRVHAETVEALERVKGRDGSGVHVDEWTKWEEEARADLERMERENGSLKGLDQWKESHQKPEGPGLKICKNGLKVRNEDGTWEHYSLKIEKAHGYHNDANAGDVEIWGSYYGNSSSTIPACFGLEIINDSDRQTDYFEADRAFVKPDHPLFWAFAQASEGGKPYTLTDDDVKRCAEYLEGKRTAAEAERKAKEDAERAERERKDDEFDRAIIDAVKTYADQYPATEGRATGRIIWSENGVLNAEGSESGKNTVFSLAALDLVIAEADHTRQRIFGQHSGYDKTKICVELPDGYTLTERLDIGDGVGGIYENHLHMIKWHAEQALGNGDDPKWVEAQKNGVEREARILEKLRPWCDLGGLRVLNDLEALVLEKTA